MINNKIKKTKWIEAENDGLIYEYSDDPEKLKEWIEKNDLKIKYRITGSEKQDAKDSNYNWLKGSNYYWLNAEMQIKSARGLIQFIYKFSYINFMEYKDKGKLPENVYYDVLCDCKINYNVPENFDEFCSEFGYNNDSMKDYKLHEECLKHNKLIKIIFDENIIDALPS